MNSKYLGQQFVLFVFLYFFSFSSFAVEMPQGTTLVSIGHYPNYPTLNAYALDPVSNVARPLFDTTNVIVPYTSPAVIETVNDIPVVLMIRKNFPRPNNENIDIFYQNSIFIPGPAITDYIPNKRGVVIKAVDNKTVMVVGEKNEIFSLKFDYNSINGTVVPVIQELAPKDWLDPQYGQITQFSPVSAHEIYAVTDSTETHMLHIDLRTPGKPQLPTSPRTFQYFHGSSIKNLMTHFYSKLVDIIADQNNVWVMAENSNPIQYVFIHTDHKGMQKGYPVMDHRASHQAVQHMASPLLQDIDQITGDLYYLYDGLWNQVAQLRGGVHAILFRGAIKDFGLQLPVGHVFYEHARGVTAGNRPTIFGNNTTGISASSAQSQPVTTQPPIPPSVAVPSLVTKDDFLREFQSLGLLKPTIKQTIEFLNHRPDLLIICSYASTTGLRDLGVFYFNQKIELHANTRKTLQDLVDVDKLAAILAKTAIDTDCQTKLRAIVGTP